MKVDPMHEMSPQESAVAEAAIRVIVSQGFDQVSIRKVAQEAGVAAGTVQYYMSTRDALLKKALQRSTARQHERVQALDRSPDPLENFTLALLELLPVGTVQREDAALWIIMGAAASTRDWLAQMYQQELELFQQLIAASVGNWLNLNNIEVSKDELARTARLVTALVNGLALDYLNTTPTSQLAGEIRGDLESGLRRIFGAIN